MGFFLRELNELLPMQRTTLTMPPESENQPSLTQSSFNTMRADHGHRSGDSIKGNPNGKARFNPYPYPHVRPRDPPQTSLDAVRFGTLAKPPGPSTLGSVFNALPETSSFAPGRHEPALSSGVAAADARQTGPPPVANAQGFPVHLHRSTPSSSQVVPKIEPGPETLPNSPLTTHIRVHAEPEKSNHLSTSRAVPSGLSGAAASVSTARCEGVVLESRVSDQDNVIDYGLSVVVKANADALMAILVRERQRVREEKWKEIERLMAQHAYERDTWRQAHVCWEAEKAGILQERADMREQLERQGAQHSNERSAWEIGRRDSEGQGRALAGMHKDVNILVAQYRTERNAWDRDRRNLEGEREGWAQEREGMLEGFDRRMTMECNAWNVHRMQWEAEKERQKALFERERAEWMDERRHLEDKGSRIEVLFETLLAHHQSCLESMKGCEAKTLEEERYKEKLMSALKVGSSSPLGP